jgi:hypothetical protein
MEKTEEATESALQFLNRLVRLQRQLARVGEDVHDRRVIMYLVKGLRSKYHSITDTWDMHSLDIDDVKRDLRQKGMRIESRTTASDKTPAPTAFPAATGDFDSEVLKRHVIELQHQFKSLPSASGGSQRQPSTRGFRTFGGYCWECGKKGHGRAECPLTSFGGNLAKTDTPIAFPATLNGVAAPARS